MSSGTFSERGKREGHNREPMIEVVSEASGTNRCGQILIGCSDDLDVDGLDARAAEPTYRPLLDCL